jgi:ATP phosphoribosyltransferase regulatory subunit
LRLCYGGPILQTQPEALKNERQLTQAGIECIGVDSPDADGEIMIIAVEMLAQLGITALSIDINLPGLLGELCPEAQDNPALKAQIKDAVTRKDMSVIAKLPLANSAVLVSLIESAGPLDKALAVLTQLKLAEAETIRVITTRLKTYCPSVSLTLDPIEYRGFDYHQGISFSIFVNGLRHELGRGGRYRVTSDKTSESATGFTLYITHLLPLLPQGAPQKRILIGQDTSPEEARRLRAEGWITLYAQTSSPASEAKHLHCSHLFEKGKSKPL